MTRKIIQIISKSVTATNMKSPVPYIHECDCLVALCDDGTIWIDVNEEWEFFSRQIPQTPLSELVDDK